MNASHQSFENKVRGEWMNDATAAAWARWHEKSVVFWSEFTRELLAASELREGQRVLDLASGTGDPALDVAKAVGPKGEVVITDLAPQMIAIARSNAREAGLANVSFGIADAHELQFPEASFDRVTCRLGVMFFWDCQKALREVRRVLKPGGIAAFVAWGPVDQNEYIRAAMGPFKKRRPPPEPAAGAPHPYRFGTPGSLGAELKASGFSAVSERSLAVRMIWPGPPEELWTRLYQVSAPLRPYFDSFAPAEREEIIKESVENFRRFYNGEQIVTKTAIVVATAVK